MAGCDWYTILIRSVHSHPNALQASCSSLALTQEMPLYGYKSAFLFPFVKVRQAKK
jgi:hypothetical protein